MRCYLVILLILVIITNFAYFQRQKISFWLIEQTLPILSKKLTAPNTYDLNNDQEFRTEFAGRNQLKEYEIKALKNRILEDREHGVKNALNNFFNYLKNSEAKQKPDEAFREVVHSLLVIFEDNQVEASELQKFLDDLKKYNIGA